MIVYAVINASLSETSPLGDAVDTFIRREDAERFIETGRSSRSGSPSPVTARTWRRRRHEAVQMERLRAKIEREGLTDEARVCGCSGNRPTVTTGSAGAVSRSSGGRAWVVLPRAPISGGAAQDRGPRRAPSLSVSGRPSFRCPAGCSRRRPLVQQRPHRAEVLLEPRDLLAVRRAASARVDRRVLAPLLGRRRRRRASRRLRLLRAHAGTASRRSGTALLEACSPSLPSPRLARKDTIGSIPGHTSRSSGPGGYLNA